jgi:hypothetical protein
MRFLFEHEFEIYNSNIILKNLSAENIFNYFTKKKTKKIVNMLIFYIHQQYNENKKKIMELFIHAHLIIL